VRPRTDDSMPAQLETDEREIAITRRTGRRKRFAAVVLRATKVC
jgi:hypothetical protein